MKIFVLYNSDYRESTFKVFNEGVDFLKRQGHNLKTDLEFRRLLTTNHAADFQSRIEKSIRDTDIIILEITNPDAKIGFDISKALSEKKIVIALYKSNVSNSFLTSLNSSNFKTLLLKKYSDKDIVNVMNLAVEEAKSKLDTKFILIISPEIDRYLDWASQTKRMHKAQIVRNSIESNMRKDREYKTFLQGNL